jgi:hypothetical protein
MRILRSLVAILAGFWFMAATLWVGTLVATQLLTPGSDGIAPASPPPAYLAALLAISALGSLMGGWLAARVAPFAPFGHACVLAVIYAVMSVNLLIGQDARLLWWYLLARCVVGVIAVLLGGQLRAAAGSAGSRART